MHQVHCTVEASCSSGHCSNEHITAQVGSSSSKSMAAGRYSNSNECTVEKGTQPRLSVCELEPGQQLAACGACRA